MPIEKYAQNRISLDDPLVSCHVSSGVRLRRIFFFQQGTPEGAYSCYVTEGVTPQKGKKTSKMRQLMHARTLGCFGESNIGDPICKTFCALNIRCDIESNQYNGVS